VFLAFCIILKKGAAISYIDKCVLIGYRQSKDDEQKIQNLYIDIDLDSHTTLPVRSNFN